MAAPRSDRKFAERDSEASAKENSLALLKVAAETAFALADTKRIAVETAKTALTSFQSTESGLQDDVDDAQAAVDLAEIAVSEAEPEELAAAEAALAVAEGELADAIALLNTSIVDALEADVVDAKAAVAAAQSTLDETGVDDAENIAINQGALEDAQDDLILAEIALKEGEATSEIGLKKNIIIAVKEYNEAQSAAELYLLI